jgi:hypothetical protein
MEIQSAPDFRGTLGLDAPDWSTHRTYVLPHQRRHNRPDKPKTHVRLSRSDFVQVPIWEAWGHYLCTITPVTRRPRNLGDGNHMSV